MSGLESGEADLERERSREASGEPRAPPFSASLSPPADGDFARLPSPSPLGLRDRDLEDRPPSLLARGLRDVLRAFASPFTERLRLRPLDLLWLRLLLRLRPDLDRLRSLDLDRLRPLDLDRLRSLDLLRALVRLCPLDLDRLCPLDLLRLCPLDRL